MSSLATKAGSKFIRRRVVSGKRIEINEMRKVKTNGANTKIKTTTARTTTTTKYEGKNSNGNGMDRKTGRHSAHMHKCNLSTSDI